MAVVGAGGDEGRAAEAADRSPIEHRAYARVGLLGNPSDVYYGRTISFSLGNFWASVRLEPSRELVIRPHPVHDLVHFDSLDRLVRLPPSPPTPSSLVSWSCCPIRVNRLQCEGYYGGVRLLMSICKVFHNYCSQNKIQLKDGNFTLSYETNIPRQVRLCESVQWYEKHENCYQLLDICCLLRKLLHLTENSIPWKTEISATIFHFQTGLSGSSAIVCAALNCLLDFYEVRHLVRVEIRPQLILDAEKELGIVAGLQDRVAQVYGGLVYMDFGKEYMDKLGHGRYIPMDISVLPPLHLIYAENPSDSGKVHSSVRKRWLDGDVFIRSSMEEVAKIAFEGHAALMEKNYHELAKLMNRNFDLRRYIVIKEMFMHSGSGRGACHEVRDGRLACMVLGPPNGGPLLQEAFLIT
ncbi:hypothetical protein Taro_041991 [Colocasia esculenta]|uniref:GHMP kinase N-terminal domain-containing protein n=1 Tax=Colocasia esculenta TaxID=4460 RepID=A0A843WXD6_COLES|nr:hypothetical protein [Colocasia esculenta]